MGIALASFPAAPLDRAARVVTRLMWAVAGLLALGACLVLVAADRAAGAFMLLSAGIVALLTWWYRARSPVAYLLEDDGIAVERRGVEPRLFVGVLSEPRRGKLGIRLAGDGGVYGYLGRFRADGRTVRAFVTSRRDVVLLRVGTDELAISPADPDGFVAAVGGGDDA